MFFVGILVGACLMYYFINKYRLVPVIQAKYISKYGSKVVTVTNVYETSVYYELDGKEYLDDLGDSISNKEFYEKIGVRKFRNILIKLVYLLQLYQYNICFFLCYKLLSLQSFLNF